MEIKNKKILVTGGYGFLGSHICKQLEFSGIKEINDFTQKGFYRFRSKDYNLTEKNSTEKLFKDYQPDIIIHAAAKVGGIGANKKYPADYFYDNLLMGVNIIHQSKEFDVKKLVIIGTICSYPKFAPIPFNEKDLWNGYPEETNAAYGIAKKSLLTQAQAYKSQYNLNYIYLMPVNLYGIGDNFNEESSHVIPALIKKFIEATKSNKDYVEIWGSGEPTREFLYVEDAAEAIIKATEIYENDEPMNLGYGTEISIRELAQKIASLVEFKGDLVFNTSQPDGQPRRCLNTSKSNAILGHYAKTDLYHGLIKTINWYKSVLDN